MTEVSIAQQDTKIVNTYAPNIRVPKCIKQMLTNLKIKIDSDAIIVGNLNTLLSTMDRSSRQTFSKETLVLNDT